MKMRMGTLKQRLLDFLSVLGQVAYDYERLIRGLTLLPLAVFLFVQPPSYVTPGILFIAGLFNLIPGLIAIVLARKLKRALPVGPWGRAAVYALKAARSRDENPIWATMEVARNATKAGANVFSVFTYPTCHEITVLPPGVDRVVLRTRGREPDGLVWVDIWHQGHVVSQSYSDTMQLTYALQKHFRSEGAPLFY